MGTDGITESTHMVWMDLEMTGLDPEVDTIIEIATLITNDQLEIIAKGPELIIHEPPERFERMDDWNKEHHTKSGLWDAVLKSEISLAEAEATTLAFIKEHVGEKKAPLAGNSVWQDRRFLVKYMPKIENWLHYRLVDVSTIKELAGRWYEGLKYPKKKGSHRAMDDIVESIEELRFYRQNVFKEKV